MLKQGVHFEDSDEVLPWGMPLQEVVNIGSPEVNESNGRIEIVWEDESLLDGIKGNWTVSYFPHEKANTFKSIGLFLTGDKKSFEAYDQFRQQLLFRLGKSVFQKEAADEKEIKWEKDNYYIHLYLFEMHEYRCSLTIGIN